MFDQLYAYPLIDERITLYEYLETGGPADSAILLARNVGYVLKAINIIT